MRFLLDESADQRLADHLDSLGHDIAIAARDYPRSLDDPTVLSIAHREGRVQITNDRDFGGLVFEHLQPHAGIILLRLKGLPLATRIARLDHVLTNHADDLDRFVVVSEQTVRVR